MKTFCCVCELAIPIIWLCSLVAVSMSAVRICFESPGVVDAMDIRLSCILSELSMCLLIMSCSLALASSSDSILHTCAFDRSVCLAIADIALPFARSVIIVSSRFMRAGLFLGKYLGVLGLALGIRLPIGFGPRY